MGSKEYDRDFVAKFRRDLDITFNAYTTSDYVLFCGDVSNTNLDASLELDSNLLFNKTFDVNEINLERMAIAEEINMINKQESGAGAGDISVKQLGATSIFNDAIQQITIPTKVTDLAGTQEDIEKIDENVLKEYIDRVFVSENMIISVVSNLEFEEIKQSFEKYFVNRAISDPTKRIKYQKTQYYDPSNYIYKIQDPTNKTVEIGIAYMSKKPERETHLYSYVEDFIFNHFAGRLMKKIRTEKGLVYQTCYDAYILPNNMALNSFYALTSKDKVNETIKLLGEIITDIAQNGITQEELDACKNMILVREQDRKRFAKTISPFTILQRYLEGTEVFFNNQIHNVKDLTLDRVNKYFRDTYTNVNAYISIKGDLPADCYSSYELQKILNTRLAQVYYDFKINKYVDYSTGKIVTKKRALEILSGITMKEKFSNLAFVYDVNSKELFPTISIAQILSELSLQDKVQITNYLLESFGVDFRIYLDTNVIEIPKEEYQNDDFKADDNRGYNDQDTQNLDDDELNK